MEPKYLRSPKNGRVFIYTDALASEGFFPCDKEGNPVGMKPIEPAKKKAAAPKTLLDDLDDLVDTTSDAVDKALEDVKFIPLTEEQLMDMSKSLLKIHLDKNLLPHFEKGSDGMIMAGTINFGGGIKKKDLVAKIYELQNMVAGMQ